jgi:hypothetical protein
VNDRITRRKSLKTGQWHWPDQLAASLPQRGFGMSFFFSFALALHADEARHAGNASLADIGGLRRLTLIEGLADGLCEEHDEAAEPNQLSRAVTGAGRDWPDKSRSVYRCVRSGRFTASSFKGCPERPSREVEKTILRFPAAGP